MRHSYARSAFAALAVASLAALTAPSVRADLQIDDWNLQAQAYTFFGGQVPQNSTTVAVPFDQTFTPQSTFSPTRDAKATSRYQVNTTGNDLAVVITPDFTIVNNTSILGDSISSISGFLKFTPSVNSTIALNGSVTYTQVTGIASGIFSANVYDITDNTFQFFHNSNDFDIAQGTTIDYSGGPFTLDAGKQYEINWFLDARSALPQGSTKPSATARVQTLRDPLTFTVSADPSVPEPASLSLLALGTAALLLRRKR